MSEGKVVPFRRPATAVASVARGGGRATPSALVPYPEISLVLMFDRRTGLVSGHTQFHVDPRQTGALLEQLKANSELDDRLFQIFSYEPKGSSRDALKARLVAVAKRRIEQHLDNLERWREPKGFLVPTEPDPDERARVRDRLRVAADEVKALCAELGVEL